MSDNQHNMSSGGIGFFGMLFLVLMVLKLTGIISSSWWIVSAPLWAPALLVLLVLAVIIFFNR